MSWASKAASAVFVKPITVPLKAVFVTMPEMVHGHLRQAKRHPFKSTGKLALAAAAVMALIGLGKYLERKKNPEEVLIAEEQAAIQQARLRGYKREMQAFDNPDARSDHAARLLASRNAQPQIGRQT